MTPARHPLATAPADTAYPTFITIDPATGAIGADFTGHVHAQGIDLDVNPSASNPPPADHALRFLETNGNVAGEFFTEDPGGTAPTVILESIGQGLGQNALDLLVLDDLDAVQTALLMTQSGRGNGLIRMITGSQLFTIMNSSGQSEFLQLANAPLRLSLAFGTGVALNFNGPPKSIITTVTHGLGVTPKLVLCWTNDIAVWAGANVTFICQANNVGLTTFDMSAIQANSAFNPGTISGNWIALG